MRVCVFAFVCIVFWTDSTSFTGIRKDGDESNQSKYQIKIMLSFISNEVRCSASTELHEDMQTRPSFRLFHVSPYFALLQSMRINPSAEPHS